MLAPLRVGSAVSSPTRGIAGGPRRFTEVVLNARGVEREVRENSGQWAVAREQWPVVSECEEMEEVVIAKRQNEANCSWC